MSVLVISIPSRVRLASRLGNGAPVAATATEVDYVFSADGLQVTAQGRCAPSALPAADSLVALVSEADLAWHRVKLPRAPAARLRQALHGALEESLLDDDSAVHFGLPPRPVAGQSTWVAVVHRSWLVAELARLEREGRVVDKVVPASIPGHGGATGHFFLTSGIDDAHASALSLAFSDEQGHSVLSLAGSLPRQRWLGERTPAPTWTASPAAAAAAEAWLGAPVQVIGDAERSLAAARSGWNLRQFDLALRRRGTRALRDAWLAFTSPAWRPVRYGLVGLIVLQLLGLNVLAYQLRQRTDDTRQAMVALLRTSYPKVRAVLDAPLQMSRETDLLRAAAGRPGDGDLETLLAAAASGWPGEAGPAQGLRFENATLSLAVPDWDAARIDAFRSHLQGQGWNVTSADGWLQLARAAGAKP